MRRWEIVIPGWTPDARLSLNGRRKKSTLLDGRGRHMPKWKETWTLENETREMVWAAMMAQPGVWGTNPLERAHVTVTFTHPINRPRDNDNGAGQAKPVIDAIKTHLIRDDSAEHMELTVRNLTLSGTTETRIVVEELT